MIRPDKQKGHTCAACTYIIYVFEERSGVLRVHVRIPRVVRFLQFNLPIRTSMVNFSESLLRCVTIRNRSAHKFIEVMSYGSPPTNPSTWGNRKTRKSAKNSRLKVLPLGTNDLLLVDLFFQGSSARVSGAVFSIPVCLFLKQVLKTFLFYTIYFERFN